MALIKCSECGKDVSDKATSCPNCGNPINTTKPSVTTAKITSTSNNEELLKCPRCDSAQLTSNKKGFSGGKAVAGAVLTGGIGLLAGTIGSDNVIITCLKCGHKFKAGDYSKEKRRLNKPSDSEIINKNPLQFIILFLSFASAIFIPLWGGSWWFLLIMPIIGFLLLIIIETLQGKNKKINYIDKGKYDITEIDCQIKEYIRSGRLLEAVKFYKEKTGVGLADAKDYVDRIASNI